MALLHGCVVGAVVCVAGTLMAAGAASAGDARAPEPPPPAVFRASGGANAEKTRTFEEGKALARETGKLLLVDATAVWCPPCKMMDKTTWVDEGVVKWIGEHAVAVQLDVDKRRDIAQELKIAAMPTVIAFKAAEGVDGGAGEMAEFDRVVGYKNAADLIAWLDGVRRGERAIDKVRAKAGKREGNAVDVDARYELAGELARAGKHAEATEEFAWLWDHMLEHAPAMVGVRGSFMASEMEALAKAHAPARERFKLLRDAAGEKMKAGGRNGNEALHDWIVLNEVVGEREKTLEWFDAAKDDPAQGRMLERVGYQLEGLLMERGRWADMAYLYRDPMGKLRRDHAMVQMLLGRQMPEGMAQRAEEMEEVHRGMFRDQAARMYASFLAAGRDEDAEKVAAEAIKLDDSGGMRAALVETALEARQAREEHLKWAQEAGDDGLGLRERVERGLKNPK